MAEGKFVGYARVSSVGQNLSVQLEKLAAAGIEPEDIFKEKRTGTDRGRPELQRCIAYVRKGDTLLVTKIDRLARSTSDLYSNCRPRVSSFGCSMIRRSTRQAAPASSSWASWR